MREPLKSMLKNLPEGLYFNKKENDLYTYCEDCNKIIHYEIRQRNIKEGPYYCRSCAQKHKTFSEEALNNISAGSKKRTGKGECSRCHRIVDYRSASGLCGECQAKSSKEIVNNLTDSGFCTNPDCDRYNKFRDQNGRGRDVGYGDGEWIADHNIIDQRTNKIIVYKEQKCGCNCSQQFYIEHNNQEHMIEHSVENLNKINERHMEFCEKCGKETLHTGFGTCLVCFPNAGGNSIKYLYERDSVRFWKDELAEDVVNGLLNGTRYFNNYPELENRRKHICYNCHDILTDDPIYFTNFLSEQNGIRFWKNERVDILVKKLLNGEKDIKDYPQLKIKLNHVCYMNQDIITDEKILYENGSSPLQVRDGVEFIHLPEIGDILKEDYFNQLESEINSEDSNEETEKLINEDGFVKEPIVKVCKNIWSRKLTDKRLVDKGYGWICYIKLFHYKPFIVGKTGTSAVHDSMIDFDFIIGDSDDLTRNGLGRQFLREKYPSENYMDYDYVLCKNFLTEHDCLKFEKYIAEKYGLFES